MTDSLVTKSIEKLLQSKVYTATDLEEEQTGFDAAQYSVEQTRDDIRRIDHVLQELDVMDVETEELEERRKQEEQLRGLKRRSQSHLLVNMGKRKNDSPEMTDVKTNLLRLEKLLYEKADEPLTADLFNEIQMGYELAIAACRYYCDHKNPFFQSGKERKAMVETVLWNLNVEADCLTEFRSEFDKGILSERNIKEILQLNTRDKSAEAASEAGQEQEEKAVPEAMAPVEKEKPAGTLSKNGKRVENILSLNIKPSGLIKKAGKSAKSRNEVIRTYMNLHDTLRQFVPGKVRCVNVTVDGREVRLLQKADNSLYIIENRQEFLMNLTAGLIADRIETDIIENDEIYGEEAVRDVVTSLAVKDGDSDTGENLRVRELCLNLILNHVGISKNDLNNVPTFLVRDIAEEIVLGGLTEDEVKELIKTKESQKLINGQENLEIVRVVKKQENGALDSKVILKKKEEEENAQVGPQWTEEEEQVKNLVADLLYDNETWSHDELLAKPGERVRRVIDRHLDIVVKLFADAYAKEDLADSMIGKMLDRLPVKMGEEGGSLKTLLLQTVKDFIKGVDNMLEEEVKKQLCATYGRGKVLDSDGNYLPDDKMPLYVKMNRNVLNFGKKTLLRSKDALKPRVQEMLSDPDSPIYSRVSNLEKDIDTAAAKISGAVQDVVTEATKAIFEDEVQEKRLGGFTKLTAEEYVENMPRKFKHFYKEATAAKRMSLEALTEEDKAGPKQSLTDENKNTFEFKKKPAKPKTLDDIIAESVKGKVGQGRFTKLVLQNYFTSVDALAQRSMIASAIRNARPISVENKNDETLIKEMAGNYLGGILKGAGPLLQKMMQGLPEAGMPKEIAGAIKDMKSNLLPIPDELIKAQLLGMVERSKGKITKMEVTKALGAASVGQAFLCKMYGPTLPPEGRNVVVKLLRPDVRNRMEREKAFMLQCADKTDNTGGMRATYEGRLKKIMEELDLTIEAKNCRMGYVYNDKKASVQSMKINEIIEPTVNSLVLEQADGTTVDKMIDESKVFLAQIDDQYRSWTENMKTGKRGRGNTYEVSAESSMQYAKDRKKLVEMLKSLEKRQAHLADLAALWVEEGIFGAGFYHGDLHAGNIMINDDHATVIDYGNAVKLTAEQQKQIIRMMGAAVTGSVEAYTDGFRALLEQTTSAEFNQKLPELTKVFTEILNMGTEAEVGQRIMASLMRAQELGLELPSSVFNFAQGELLLQNTISDINKLIEETRQTMEKMDAANVKGTPRIDAASILHDTVFRNVEMADAEKHGIYKGTKTALGDVDKEELLSAVRKTKKIKANAKTGAPAVDERVEFDQKYMSGMTGIKDAMYVTVTVRDSEGKKMVDAKGKYVEKKVPFEPAEIRRRYQELKKKKDKGYKTEEERQAAKKEWSALADSFSTKAVIDDKLDIFGGTVEIGMLIAGVSTGEAESFERLMEIMDHQVNATAELEQALKALRKEQDSWFPDQEKLKRLEEDFYQKYNRVHHIRGNSHMLLKAVEKTVTAKDMMKASDAELKPWFEDEREGLGPRLKAAYDALRRVQKIVWDKESALSKYERDKQYHETAEQDLQTAKARLELSRKGYETAVREYDEARKTLKERQTAGGLSQKDEQELKDKVDLKKNGVRLLKNSIAALEHSLPEREKEWEQRKNEVIGERPPEVTEDERNALNEPKAEFMKIYRELAVLRLGDVSDCYVLEPGEESALKDISDIVGEVVVRNATAAGRMVGMKNAYRFARGMVG